MESVLDDVLAAGSFFEPPDPLLELDESDDVVVSEPPLSALPFSAVAGAVDRREPRLSVL